MAALDVTRPPDTQDRHGILIRQLQGAMSTALQPGDPAGGDLRGTYPNPTLKPREGAGRVVGIGLNFEGPFSGAIDFYDNRSGTIVYFNLAFTPSVNCWWPVDGQVLVKTIDAAWNIMNVSLLLTPADALGASDFAAVIQHNVGAGTHVTANPKALWALSAGTAYQCKLRTSYQSGGSWYWYDGGSQHSWIQSPGVVPR